MAISLKELSEKITKPGFWSPNYKSMVELKGSNGYLKYNITAIGYIGSDLFTSFDQIQIIVNGKRIVQAYTARAGNYYANTNIITPVKPGDVIEFTDCKHLHNIDQRYGYFIPAILTIYYIVRYNIYMLVRFLSHLNTKFGGERR